MFIVELTINSVKPLPSPTIHFSFPPPTNSPPQGPGAGAGPFNVMPKAVEDNTSGQMHKKKSNKKLGKLSEKCKIFIKF